MGKGKKRQAEEQEEVEEQEEGLVSESDLEEDKQVGPDNVSDDDDDDAEEEDDDDDDEEEEQKQHPKLHPRLQRQQEQQEKKKKGGAAAAAGAAGSAGATEEDAKEAAGRKWVNRQRTLVFSSRGVSYRARHLMTDLRALMPHSKKEAKMDRKDRIGETIPEICELRNCNNCVYFEMRKKRDLYLWVSKMPHGPSAKFLVENVHTMDELKLTGNCLKGSRPLLDFDAAFDKEPHFRLLKELFVQTFGTPRNHPKSKAFIDHVLSFFILDGRVWMRNYQITWRESNRDLEDTQLTEIGPRFCLNPIRIFDGCFGGPTLYENPTYTTPNAVRAAQRLPNATKYRNRTQNKVDRLQRLEDQVLSEDEMDTVFHDAVDSD